MAVNGELSGAHIHDIERLKDGRIKVIYGPEKQTTHFDPGKAKWLPVKNEGRTEK